MKVSNGSEHFELERSKNILQVRLTSTQFKEEALKELPDNVNVKEENESWVLSYSIPENSKSLATAIQNTKSRLEKLKLAQKLSSLADLVNQFDIPFIHPENIMLEGETLFVVHFGLKGLIVPNKMTSIEFINSYKALIFNIFNSKSSFEAFIASTRSVNDKFTQTINDFNTISEITSFINQEVEKETVKVNQKLTNVSKGRYRFFKYFGIFAIILALVLGWFTYSYYSNNQKQNAVITAQTDFLTNNYAQTQTDLQSYSPNQLPKSARYILAVSSVNLSDLSMSQKQSILNNVSTKSDNNTLNYWVYTGRGDFNQALNLAQNLGDKQLTLLAYTNLYEATKLNTTMNGAKKQQLLDKYNKQIQELTKDLGK
ncbi:type VII secretion protein EssB [Lactococcus allomyrinae]|uniref:Type VII secretion protein EssB n=1 Tax=Lactococcus allomyrinae TaxID=2419773 RepID=A0A387BPM6_9LACT|nr:type VII secretion protein EssB [Lactococcus allomyrinae]AYG00471.1 type VII secretion protein EssB [Lactococcus allomyrinae]